MEVEVFFGSWKIAESILDRIGVDLEAFFKGAVALLFAHVTPSIFDVGDSTFIDGLHV